MKRNYAIHQGRNRHSQMRRHKRRMKQQYAAQWGYTNIPLLMEEREAELEEDSWWIRKHPPRNNGFEYWQLCYLSGPRGFAKRCTNRKIRNRYREMIAHMDPEDVPAYQRSDYEKEFDYHHTIW